MTIKTLYYPTDAQIYRVIEKDGQDFKPL